MGLLKIMISRHGQYVFFKGSRLDFGHSGALSPISLNNSKVIQITSLFCFPGTSFYLPGQVGKWLFLQCLLCFYYSLDIYFNNKKYFIYLQEICTKRGCGQNCSLKSGPSTAAWVTADKGHTSGCYQPIQSSTTLSGPFFFI